MPTENPLVAAGNVREMAAAAVVGAEQGALKFAVEAVNKVKELLSQQHTGPSYPSAYGRPGGNPSSRPGEPPALQTGWLRSSYAFWKEEPGVIAIGSRGSPPKGTNYSGFLEFGTSRTAARPHLRPAIDAVKERLRAEVSAEVSAAQAAARGKMGP